MERQNGMLERGGGARDGQLALRMSDREHADRREEERRRRLRAEHLHREVALRVAGEHPRLDAAPLEGLAVRADRRLPARTAGDVAERAGIELLLGQRLPLLGRHRPLRLAGDVDGVLDASAVERHAAASSFARSSSVIGRAARCSGSQHGEDDLRLGSHAPVGRGAQLERDRDARRPQPHDPRAADDLLVGEPELASGTPCVSLTTT